MVIEAVLLAVDSPELAKSVLQAAPATSHRRIIDALRSDEAALRALDDDYYDLHRIDRARYLELRSRLEDRIAATNRRMASQTGSTARASLAGVARSRWPKLSLDAKRAVIAAVVTGISVGPGRRGYNKFDPARIDVSWRDDPGPALIRESYPVDPTTVAIAAV